MPRISAAFFSIGVLCVLCGMGFGMWMGASGNFTAAPAHAHLNLVGWVTSALYGTFYALAKNYAPKLAWTQFVISTIGILIMIPSLFLLTLNSNDPKFEPGITGGSMFVFVGMILFAVSVFKELTRAR
jgi:cbb3-type cytochrome oxidase subunit 1